jgi:hypothetical protein
MQMIDWSRGGYIIPSFPPVIEGYAAKVGGTVESRTGQPFNMGAFEKMWVSS